MSTATDTRELAVKILQDWRNQNNMLASAMAGIADLCECDGYTTEDVSETLVGLIEALDECSRNLARSIAGMQ